MPVRSAIRPLIARPATWTLLVFLAALTLRLLGAGVAPMHPDEYYTILAARSYLEDGMLRIWEGQYLRARGFTVLVAGSLEIFGDSLLAARLPSLLASALIVPLAFVWLRREAGLLAAVLLAALLIFSANAIEVAQFARFYALHAALFLVAALAVYRLFSPDRAATARIGAQAVHRRRVRLIAVALLAAAGAAHLQEVTGIGLVALGVWAAAAWWFERTPRARLDRRGMVLAVVLAVACVAAAWVVDLPNRAEALYDRYRWVALWNAEHRDYPRYYLHQMGRELPLFFYTFPIAALIALARAPRPALFCLIVCAVALAVHSFAGMKELRYVHYLWPLLLAIWAIAGSALVEAMGRAAASLWQRVEAVPLARRLRVAPVAGAISTAAIVVAIFAALAGNPDYQPLRQLPVTVAAQVGVGPLARARRQAAQAERDAVAALRQLAAGGGMLVTSSELLALWHLEHFDLLVRAGRLHEFEPGGEFDRDPRTGASVISTAESLGQVMACHRRGTLIVWPDDWRRRHVITPEVADLVEARMREVPVPAAYGARAFRWHRAEPPEQPCSPTVARLGSRRIALRH